MSANQPSENHASAGAKLLSALASVKFAVTVVALIAIACFAGTVIPQGAEVDAYLRHHPQAAGRMGVFDKLGLTHVFYSVWFLSLLGILAASVATCSTRRFLTMSRTTGFARRRAFGSMITHISILLILAGAVIRGVWGEKGYIELRRGQTQARFEVGKGSKALPFALHLLNFEIETYNKPSQSKPQDDGLNQLLVQWPEKNIALRFPIELGVERVVAPQGETPTAENSYRIKILKYVADFVVDMSTKEVTSRSNEPNNPAILVAVTGPQYQNHRWLFARFPDFGMHTADSQSSGESPLRLTYQSGGASSPVAAVEGPIKSFKSTLQVIDAGRVVQTRVVEVNSPFRYQGYTFYQSGYNPRDLGWTSLQVVRDPGVPAVYAGFLLMIAGLFVVFYLNPWIEKRTVPESLGAQVPAHPAAPVRKPSGTRALGHVGTH